MLPQQMSSALHPMKLQRDGNLLQLDHNKHAAVPEGAKAFFRSLLPVCVNMLLHVGSEVALLAGRGFNARGQHFLSRFK